MKNNKEYERQPPQEYRLSDDFIITYTAYPNEQNKKGKNSRDIKYSLRMPISEEQKKRNKNAYGKMASKNRLSFTVFDNGLKNLERDLFNEIWNNNKVRKNVLKEVEKLLNIENKRKNKKSNNNESGQEQNKEKKKREKKQYRINGVSILLFSYVYIDELKKEIGFDEATFFTLVKDERIGNIFLCKETTEEEINNAANSYYKNTKRISKKAIQNYLNIILKYAIAKKIIKNSITVNITANKELYDEDQKRIVALKREMVSKSFTKNQEEELIIWLLSELIKNNAYLGILIKMFTGMTTAEVCALDWGDYERIDKSNRKDSFEIVKEIKKNSKLFTILVKALSKRSMTEAFDLTWEDYEEIINLSVEKEFKLNDNEKTNISFLGILTKIVSAMLKARKYTFSYEDFLDFIKSNYVHHFKITKKMKDNSSKETDYYRNNQKQKFRLVPIPYFLDKIIMIQYRMALDFSIKKFRKKVLNEVKEIDLNKKTKQNKEIEQNEETEKNPLLEKINKLKLTEGKTKALTNEELYELFNHEINEDLNKLPIVCQNIKLKKGERFIKRFNVKSINNYAKKAINQGITKSENKFLNPISNQEVDLEKAHSFIFHTNYQFHTIFDSNMGLGELNYILGNISDDTFANHYCDFSDDCIQIKLSKMLDLWVDSHFPNQEGEHIVEYKRVTEKSSRNINVNAGFNQNAKVNISFVVEEKCETEITIENNHGFSGDITLYKTER